LQYVPFAALPVPKNLKSGVAPRKSNQSIPRQLHTTTSSPQTSTDGLPLIVEHEIINLPSASVLDVLRQDIAARVSSSAKPATLAVIADPVFQIDDPRVRRDAKSDMISVASNAAALKKSASDTDTSDVRRAAREAGLTYFVRLPFSRQEAEQIAALAPAQTSFKALDFAANRATITGDALNNYRVVHFATHTLVNNQHPDFSGIVLSLVDEEGRPQNGFLRLYEIYNLRLNADLVVLSACQTALGKDVKGEGLIGLTRGFMYAGVPRIVASLWSVPDKATAELMRRFYINLLRDKQRPAAALRLAQISMWRERRYRAPYHWAAFTLQGEWR